MVYRVHLFVFVDWHYHCTVAGLQAAVRPVPVPVASEWNIDRQLSRFVKNPLGFRSQTGWSNALLVGSVATAFFGRVGIDSLKNSILVMLFKLERKPRASRTTSSIQKTTSLKILGFNRLIRISNTYVLPFTLHEQWDPCCWLMYLVSVL